MEEDREYLKLPVEERCVHKLWKARVSGYEEAAKIFRQIDDEKSPEWSKYVGLIKKFVVDTNAPAQEKGLEAVLAFIENSALAGKTVGDVMSGITQKCVAASKTRTKELALQISLACIEIEKHDIVIDELIKGTESKNPKIVSACTSILTQALRTFGVKVVNVNKVMKRAPLMLEDRDSSVRTEARQLIVEVCRWIGIAIRPHLSAVKPVQLAEIEPELEKMKDEKAKPARLLRSQQAKKVAASEEQRVESGELGDEVDDTAGCETDPYDLLDPIDVLGKLPKDFYLQLEAKKWLERKEALEVLEKTLAAAPKIENADYGDLIRALKKIILKDSNVAVIAVAIKCVTGLATGLKKKFHPYAGILVPSLLEKFKEKKQNVVVALREAVDAIYPSTSLELMLEDILAALDNKNPSVKAETVSFLARCFLKCTPTILNKKMLKALVPALLNTLLSSDPTVRENAVAALGTAMKVVGEKGIGPYLGDLESLKMVKVKEFSEKVELSVKQPKKVVSSQLTLPSISPSKSVVQKQVSDKTKSVSTKSKKDVSTSRGSGDRVIRESEPIVKKSESKPCMALSPAEVMKKVNSILPADLVSSINSNDSKLTYTALNQLKQLIESESLNSEECLGQLIIFLLVRQQALKESDEQNLKLRLEIIKCVGKLLPVTEGTIDTALISIIECMVESMNCRELANDTLVALCDATSLDYISSAILDQAFLQNDPKILAEALNWVSNEVMKRGIFGNADFLNEAGKKALLQTNTLVRNAGLALIGTIHLQTGDPNGEKPKKQVLNPTVSKRSIDKTRSKDIEKDQMNIDLENVSEDGLHREAEVEEQITRIDISPQITDVLISELLDKNWKVRGEAVCKFQNIVSTARYITPNLGEASCAVASRISDSNTKIAASAIALVEMLATAIGPQCKQYTKVFLPALLRAVGDAKPWIRSAVVTCLNVWSNIGGYKEFFEGEMIADALRSGTTNVRTELWAWLAEKLPKWKNIPKDELVACLPTLYANLEDRFAEVRKNASDAVLGFMIHLGFSSMMNALENMKNGGGSQVKATLEKTRGLLPEKVPPRTRQQSTEKPVRPVKLSPGSSATITKSPKSKTILKPVALRKKEEDVDTSPLLQVNNLKHQRIIDEQKLKTLKWNFTTPRAEFVELLRDQMIAANINKTLIANMFNTDFKYHLRAIDALTEDLSSNRVALMSNLDLILRWMTIRFFDTNPSVLLKGLEYLNLVFSVLIEEEYNMLDNEAASFFPYLILKAGDPKDTVRNSVKAILKQIGSVYPFCKQFSYVMDGLKSKNARQRAECLEQLGWLIENYGVTVCHPTPVAALKEIAKHIADRDTSVRNAALNCVVTAYFLDGDKILKMVGHISDKDMYLLEERIKRAAKNRPVASVKPMQTNVAAISPPSPEQVTSLVTVAEPSYDDEDIESHAEQIEINFAATSGVISTSRLSRGSLDDLDSSPSSSSFVSVKTSLEHMSDPSSARVFSSPIQANKQKMLPGQGPYGLDPNVLDEIECAPVQFQAPKLVDIDLQFLKDPATQSSVNPIQMPKVTPSLSKYTQPSAIKWELALIASGDIEKAMSAMNRIDTVLNSDKRNNLSGFVDYMVSQLVHQLVILNQSTHPDLVNCYRANFSLLIKLCKFQDLCQQITEQTLYKVLEQLLILLTEHRFVTIDKHEMFLKVVNCLVIHLLDNTNKTNMLCALIKMLYDTLNNPQISNHYQELVVKCLWKLNRTQPEWDMELNYIRILTEINTFLRDYPTVWWKHQEGDVPLRTVKTILHSMVKLRGIEVRDHLRNIPGITTDSEMYHYIKKVIKHLKVENVADSSKENEVTQSLPTPSLRLTKEAQEELTDIFRMIGDVEETTEGIQRLFTFKKTYPEADLEPYLAKSAAVFQQYIKRGLAALEMQHNSSEEIKKSQKSQTVGKYETSVSVELTTAGGDPDSSSQKGTFTKEAERLWYRLQHLQEQAGCHHSEEKPNSSPETVKETDSYVRNGSHRNQQDDSVSPEIKSIKERLDFIKGSFTGTNT